MAGVVEELEFWSAVPDDSAFFRDSEKHTAISPALQSPLEAELEVFVFACR